jgi:hypothetical protein
MPRAPLPVAVRRPLPPGRQLVDELVEVARLHGVELMVVVERTDLPEPDGVAAVVYDLDSV